MKLGRIAIGDLPRFKKVKRTGAAFPKLGDLGQNL
jgi:hypothetical protein